MTIVQCDTVHVNCIPQSNRMTTLLLLPLFISSEKIKVRKTTLKTGTSYKGRQSDRSPIHGIYSSHDPSWRDRLSHLSLMMNPRSCLHSYTPVVARSGNPTRRNSIIETIEIHGGTVRYALVLCCFVRERRWDSWRCRYLSIEWTYEWCGRYGGYWSGEWGSRRTKLESQYA